jgi:Phospholipase_D-nuclease N-terminal
MTLIGLLHLVLVIYTVYLIFTGPRSQERKLLWLIVVVIFPVLGPILYLLMRVRI